MSLPLNLRYRRRARSQPPSVPGTLGETPLRPTPHMRNITTVLLSLTVVFVTALPGKQKAQEFRGELSDKLCGLSHPELISDAKQCTLDCVRAGSRYVLASKEKGMVYELVVISIPEELAGERVVITGRWNKKRRVLRVYSIAPAH